MATISVPIFSFSLGLRHVLHFPLILKSSCDLQKNACILPEDLKNFYLMTDGFQMTWSVKIDGKCMCLFQLMPLYLADNPSFAERL